MEPQTIALIAAAIASLSSVASPIVAVLIANKSSETALETAKLTKRTADEDRELAYERLRVEVDKERHLWIWEQRRSLFESMFMTVDELIQCIGRLDPPHTVFAHYELLANYGPRHSLYGTRETQAATENLIKAFKHALIQQDVASARDFLEKLALPLSTFQNAVRAAMGMESLQWSWEQLQAEDAARRQ